jgi:hypothetical protein
MKETVFQKSIINDLKRRFPGIIILKTDPKYLQGVPDLLILWNNKWAALEVKKSKNEHHQPNQDYYVSKLKKMSYASFIYPENKEDVYNDLEQTLQHE